MFFASTWYSVFFALTPQPYRFRTVRTTPTVRTGTVSLLLRTHFCGYSFLQRARSFLSNQIYSSVLMDSPIDLFIAHEFLRQLVLIIFNYQSPISSYYSSFFKFLRFSCLLDGFGFLIFTPSRHYSFH